MSALKMSNGFDVGLEMSGHPAAFNDMLDHMYHGGYIALLGFLPPSTTINWDQMISKGLHLKGIYGREMFETWYKMTQMLRSGLDIRTVITHHYFADDFEAALETLRGGQCGKVILDWSECMTQQEPRFEQELRAIRQPSLYKQERVITTPQDAAIATHADGEVLNFCANNYLGLANHPEIAALRTHGYGMASVRFICGTQDLHKRLERAVAAFMGTETPYWIRRASTPTPAYSRRCSARKTR